MKIKLLFLLASVPIFSQLVDPNPNDDWAISQVGSNNLLKIPYDIALANDGYLWITERKTGDIARYNPTSGNRDLLITLTNVSSSGFTYQQDGLMGIVFHPDFGKNLNNDYVYVAYTYSSNGLKVRLSRLTYTLSGNDGILFNETTILENLPGSFDHNSGRLAIGPDRKLYYSIGDQGNNQYDNKCIAIKSQNLPTTTTDYANYQGKILRINLDGTIPSDNPTLSNVKSHVYSFGHRNAQGLVFGSNGKLYASEHGPKSDDELNIIESGINYGWPIVSGYNDNKSYTYCNWSSKSNCTSVTYNEYSCPRGATSQQESSWQVPTNYKEPIATWGTVDNTYDFQATCGTDGTSGYLCWPTIAPSGMDIYENNKIPDWNNSLLTTALKRGRIYRTKLSSDGNSIVPIADPEPDTSNDDAEELWYTQNRYRDVVAAPDGLTFYIITDSSGKTSGPTSNGTFELANPGSIIKVEYTGATLKTNAFANGKQFSITPNPAKNEFKIEVDPATTIESIKIYDLNGRIVYQETNPIAQNLQIKSQLANGIYLLNLTDNLGFQSIQKLVIKN
jgi:aldose sugar dehydrogenase